jgi:N-methylhydantoinase A/oxoprolinase/acetone carboxylase beta subunit
VTDANLMLGHLSADVPLAGDVELDADAAHAAVERLAGELRLEAGECAEGIVRVANAEMVRALRVMTVERGIDPRRFALLAFGGAGPLHAAAIAEELGMTKILVPRASGVLSALGLAAADRRADAQRTVLGHDGSDPSLDTLRDEVGAALGGEPEIEVAWDLRYRGQSHELTVRGAARHELRERFEALHEERYGHRDSDGEVELVTVRVTGRLPAPAVDFGAPAGEEVQGPTVVALPEATLVVPEGWSGSTDDTGTLVLERAS